MSNAKEWASKLAYAVPAPKTHSTMKPLAGATRPSNIPKTTAIGARKPARPAPPAALDAQAASKSMTPATKTAAAPAAPKAPKAPVPGVKKAPRYSSRARKGKQIMPLPNATRTKKAAFGIKLAMGGMGGAMGMEQPGAMPTTADPSLQQPPPPPLPGMGGGDPAGAMPMPQGAKPPSPMDFGAMLGGMPQAASGSQLSQPGSTPATPPPPPMPGMPGTGAAKPAGALGGDLTGMGAPPIGGGGPAGGGDMAAGGLAKAGSHQKQALGGIGTLIGALGGTVGAPSGNKTEGLGRGVGKGLGWDIGGGAGMGLGALGGGALGPAIMAAIAKARGQEVDPAAMAGAAGSGAALGGAAGYLGGGLAGKGVAGSMMGDPSWKSKEHDDIQQEAALA